MGFRSLARSLILTISIAAAATAPVFAQQQPAPKPPAQQPAPAQPAAPQQAAPGQSQPQAPGTVKSNHGAWSSSATSRPAPLPSNAR